MEAMRDRVQKELEKLTPEQRMEVWRATWALLKMPPEKKKEIMGVDEDRRRRMREEIEQAINENGIEIGEGRKREFYTRYFQGRREIEMKLIKEGEERRRALMKELGEKLKVEFGKSASPQDAGAK